MATPPRSLLGMLPHELAALVAAWGEPAYRGRQVFHWLHGRGVLDPLSMTDLPLRLRQRLPAPASEEVRRLQSADGLTRKLLLRLRDGQEIEAVEMNTAPTGGRKTICVSTQAGCAMACVFCVTGQFGFARNLEAGEIVEQVLRCNTPDRPVTNVVFMGMGEPLANYDETLRAIRLLIHPDGLRLGARRITLSTSGLVPQIERLAGEGLQIGLAISLHAPNDALRTSLMPVNRRWPIADLLAAADHYVEQTGRRVSFEYTLMDGKNDSDELADQLADILSGRLCHVNLIPLNPTEDLTLHASSMARAYAFEGRLRAAGIAATIRVNRGRDIMAACGQLRLNEKRRREQRLLAPA
ncbi:MAG: 23S rRNA (adenine(2503)-C(2))-methyltransferase RlmN [Chloroflexota bacterium]|nr:23S rRNA (adenine(2503)-C(2))-methyltransferase RlmN [Chloroflexota bacterium]